MPAERQPAPKRPRLPFNPPRPRASPGEGPSTSTPATKTNTKGKTTASSRSTSKPKPTPKPKRKSTTNSRKKSPPPPAEASPSPSASGSESGSEDRERVVPEEPDYVIAEIAHGKQPEDVTSSEPAVPGKLLTRLLHHNFQNEKTKIAKDANELVAKYVDVFVREAVARAAYERAEGGGGAGPVGDGFLEVEDLEKMAPQLVLDF